MYSEELYYIGEGEPRMCPGTRFVFILSHKLWTDERFFCLSLFFVLNSVGKQFMI